MFEIGEICTAAHEPPAFCFDQRHVVMDRRAPVEDFVAFARKPVAEVLQTPEGGALAQLRRADGDGVEEFLDLGQKFGLCNDGSDAVAREAVGLGKGIKLDQRVVPVRVREQAVRWVWAAVEIAVGLINDQPDAGLAGEGEECGECLCRVFDAAGIVRCHQRNCAGPRRDQRAGGLGIGDQIGAGGQRHSGHTRHVEPHFMIEVPGSWQENLIPFGAKCRDDGGKGLIAARRDRDLIGACCALVMR
jgi:hypothetical protein